VPFTDEICDSPVDKQRGRRRREVCAEDARPPPRGRRSVTSTEIRQVFSPDWAPIVHPAFTLIVAHCYVVSLLPGYFFAGAPDPGYNDA
jgi:hypothetical protein